MINQHILCPKKALDKYEIESKLPPYQTVPRQEPQKKNHKYYHDNFHIWNNNHQAKSNMKVFAQIKDQNQRGEERIKRLQDLEKQDKSIMEMNRIAYLNQAHEQDLQRLQTRKMERAGLQNLCSQQTDLDCEQCLLKPILSQAPLLGRPDFLWNRVNKQSQKYVNMLINPKIIAMEEEAVKQITKRIEKEEQIQQIQEELRLENMQKIRRLSAKRIQENAELQSKSGISPIRKNQIIRVNTAKTNQNQTDLIEQTLNVMSNPNHINLNFTSRPFTVGSINDQIENYSRPKTSQMEQRLHISATSKINHSRTNILSQPRLLKNELLQNSRVLDRSECKGLYLAQAAELCESNFGKTIKQNSSYQLNNNMSYQSKMSSKIMKPKRLLRKKQSASDLPADSKMDEVTNMLDSFEKKLHRPYDLNDDLD